MLQANSLVKTLLKKQRQVTATLERLVEVFLQRSGEILFPDQRKSIRWMQIDCRLSQFWLRQTVRRIKLEFTNSTL